MARYGHDHGGRWTDPGLGNLGPEYTGEIYGGGFAYRRGPWRSGRGPGGYGWDYRPGGYGRDYLAGGYGRDYRAGGEPGRRGFGERRPASGYRGPGTDLGEDIRRGYVSRWREPRYGPDGPPWRRW